MKDIFSTMNQAALTDFSAVCHTGYRQFRLVNKTIRICEDNLR